MNTIGIEYWSFYLFHAVENQNYMEFLLYSCSNKAWTVINNLFARTLWNIGIDMYMPDILTFDWSHISNVRIEEKAEVTRYMYTVCQTFWPLIEIIFKMWE